jgi:hypothetical protein
MFRMSRPFWFNYLNNTWRRLQIFESRHCAVLKFVKFCSICFQITCSACGFLLKCLCFRKHRTKNVTRCHLWNVCWLWQFLNVDKILFARVPRRNVSHAQCCWTQAYACSGMRWRSEFTAALRVNGADFLEDGRRLTIHSFGGYSGLASVIWKLFLAQDFVLHLVT